MEEEKEPNQEPTEKEQEPKESIPYSIAETATDTAAQPSEGKVEQNERKTEIEAQTSEAANEPLKGNSDQIIEKE